MDGIFISYRRDDSAGYAGRLYDRLAAHFGSQRVFMDVEGIEPGVDFVTAIEEAVGSCRVLIVIIGDEWTQARDGSGRRRLDDPNDFIRLETGTALQRGIRVVPVLVDGASMPHVDDLPDDLKPLTRRQAIEISHKQWESSTGELVRTLEGLLANQPTGSLPKAPAMEQAAESTTPTTRARRQWVLPIAAIVLLALGIGVWFSRGPDGAVPSLPLPPETPLAVGAKPGPANDSDHRSKASVEQSYKSMPSAVPPLATVTEVHVPDTASSVPKETDLVPAAKTTSPPAEPIPTKPAIATPDAEPVRLAVPAPTPPPVAAPIIRIFRAEVSAGNARLCYRVSNADQLTLSPRPGELEKVDQDCVDIALEQKTLFTLSARNASKIVRRNLLVVPEAIVATPSETAVRKSETAVSEAPKVVASSYPLKGERWAYRSSGKWPTSPKRVFEIAVQSVSGDVVIDTVRAVEPSSSFASQERQSNGKQPGFVSWTDLGPEFSPYFGAYFDLSRQESMSDLSTPDLDRLWQQWFSNAKVIGKESISVPAGTFDAFKVEVWSNRHATGGRIRAGVEPVSIRYQIWYAAQAKRYVKMHRQITSASGIELEHDVFELVSHKSPD